MARSPARRDPRERRDRDYRRRSRDRSGTRRDDRYDDRAHGSGRYDDRRDRDYGRPRSRERKRSRDTSPVRDRDRRDRDRYRDDRYYDDRDRDSKRLRRDDDQPRRRREDSRQGRESGGNANGAKEASRPSTADAEEEAKKARQAKVEAWKKKQLLKKGIDGSASPSANDSGAVSPATTSNAAQPSADPNEANDEDASAPAQKFDHKAIKKRATAALEREKQKTALGGDVVIPKSTTHAPPADTAKLANKSKANNANTSNGASSVSSSKISGFGLNTATADIKDKSAVAKTAAPLGEEEEAERKWKPPILDVTDPGRYDVRNHWDADRSMVVSDDPFESISDDEEREEVRKFAKQRVEKERARRASNDVVMTDAPSSRSSVQKAEEEEEVDPLDAFMNDLEQAAPEPSASAVGKTKKGVQVFDNDDDDGANLNAIGDDTDEAIAAAAAKRKRKEIPQVDHAKMNYEPFRKQFYSESIELSEMTPEDVEILRSDLDNIKCRGMDVPKPIVKWSQGGFGAQILDIIRDQKFEKPTSIQSQALPAIMSGRDVIGVAKTGSGKTLAFLLPMFRHIKDQRPLSNLEGPIGLVVAPTRELATQIHRECKPFLRALDLRAVCAYGGAPIKDQIAELKRGAEIVVCTPGRMIDLLAANSGRVVNLTRVTYIVLDEADRMFDMGFEPQITRVLSRVRPERQTVLFSATFPKSMEALARKALTKPVEIIVGGRSVVAAEITQQVEVVEENKKFGRTLQLLGKLLNDDEDARCLIFVERQETADNMLKELARVQYPSVSIHGGREQIDRDQAISDFKAGIFPIMIATSVAARGLDVKQLKLVINYDSPNHIEDYVHRSGRTGRAGNTGTAVTFVTAQQDRFAPFLVRALTDSKQEIPEPLAALAKSHEEKVKSGEAKKISSGFGGRGIEQLDAARDAEKAVQKKQYKTEDGDDDEEEDAPKKTKAQTEVDKMIAKASTTVKEHEGRRNSQPETALPTDLDSKLSDAMVVKKAEPPAPKPNKGGPKPGQLDPMAAVRARAEALNSRIGPKSAAARPTVPVDNRGPDAGAFHAILEIHDFPQTARWKVTNRTNVAKVLESTGVSITTKGQFYKDGQEPQPGQEPKLYVLVEGDTENAVEGAMKQLTTLLRDGTIESIEKSAQGTTGRYTV